MRMSGIEDWALALTLVFAVAFTVTFTVSMCARYPTREEMRRTRHGVVVEDVHLGRRHRVI